MTSSCRIDLLPETITNTIDDLVAAPLNVFFAYGIVNPSGPTLSFVAAVGNHEIGAVLPIVNVMLNPFSQSVEQVGRFVCGNTWNPAIDLIPLFGLRFGSCPTLVQLSQHISEDSRVDIAKRLLIGFDNVVSAYSKVHRFPNNPWDRVTAEMSVEIPREGVSAEVAARRLAEIVLTKEHFWAELPAFFYAWNGSIEQTGITGRIKSEAMTLEQFKAIYIDQVAPSLWTPEPLSTSAAGAANEPIPTSAPLKFSDANELRALLADEAAWVRLSDDNLLEFLRDAMTLYGAEINEGDVPMLARLYTYAVGRTDVEHRGHLTMQLNERVERLHLSAKAFYPILIREPDMGVASTATINFLSCSPAGDDGLPLALGTLEYFFESGAIENPGAVFGAVICMGDRALWPFIDAMRIHLTAPQVNVAARVYTPFLQHWAIQYWLRWAGELVGLPDSDSEKMFGSTCLNLAGSRADTQNDGIAESRRHYPCFEFEYPVEHLKVWSLADYATEIAEELYELERREPPPKLMSDVLRTWGLPPRAKLIDQYIPEK
ncbi:MAG: hypothetical protein IPO13_00910 [Rhodocyclaceae bacterium]|nr:hypothetical protein [Rhodocyclaceae bacterium]